MFIVFIENFALFRPFPEVLQQISIIKNVIKSLKKTIKSEIRNKNYEILIIFIDNFPNRCNLSYALKIETILYLG